MYRSHIFTETIVPKRIIYDRKKVIQISDIEKNYIITKVIVLTDGRNRIKEIKLKQKHPNCDPETNIFCIPDYLRNVVLDKNIFKIITILISTYNLDNCYFTPWKFVEWKY